MLYIVVVVVVDMFAGCDCYFVVRVIVGTGVVVGCLLFVLLLFRGYRVDNDAVGVVVVFVVVDFVVVVVDVVVIGCGVRGVVSFVVVDRVVFLYDDGGVVFCCWLCCSCICCRCCYCL